MKFSPKKHQSGFSQQKGNPPKHKPKKLSGECSGSKCASLEAGNWVAVELSYQHIGWGGGGC